MKHYLVLTVNIIIILSAVSCRNLDEYVSLISIDGEIHMPDIDIASFYIYGGDEYRYFDEGQDCQIYIDIINLGPVDADRFLTAVYLLPLDSSYDEEPVPLTICETSVLAGLSQEIKEIRLDNIEMYIPDYYVLSEETDYVDFQIIAYADVEDVITEFNEANNRRALTIRIYTANQM